MDGNRFDQIVRTVATSRRPVARGVFLVSVFGVVSQLTRPDETGARKKGKGKHKKKKKPQDFTEGCNPSVGYSCPGCCDGQGRCRDGLAKDACGIGEIVCTECIGPQECTAISGKMECCVPLDRKCDGALTCCPGLQCGNGRCCRENGGRCAFDSDCCDGECAGGTCCAEGDRACVDDDDCCGDRPCLRFPFTPAFVCCPTDRQCSGRCCTDTDNRIFNTAGDCGCCEPPKEVCEGSLMTGCCDPATQQCCSTGMCCGLNSTCLPNQTGCSL